MFKAVYSLESINIVYINLCLMEVEVPKFSGDFLCIANMDEMVLTAVASSYIVEANRYLPLFEFPHVTAPNAVTDERNLDPHHMSRSRAQAFNIQVHNCINRLQTCNNIVLIGLTAEQKGYLTFLDNFNIIEIERYDDVGILLGPFTEKCTFFKCREEDVLEGLYNAITNGDLLQIDEQAGAFSLRGRGKKGIVVLENINRVSSVIAVNYAFAVGNDIKVIAEPGIGHREISNLIEEWQGGSQNAYNDLSAAIYKYVQDIEFTGYGYGVFFTKGAPYSLILKNIIPFCHVHYQFHVDFFVFNAIYFETFERVPSAIVFSPEEFDDEETLYVVQKAQQAGLYVRKLIGDEATVANLDNHVQHYPYELLHICSHGGEVEGVAITEEFTDQDGIVHVVEYDEVLSLGPEEGEEKIKVATKMLWRKLDGLVWMSKELKAKDYPHYVYTDMMNAIRKNKDKDRSKRKIVPNSSAIKCADFNYQAMFNYIAAGHSPIVFNNTCWSWSDIADSFLGVGARTYIGTLWKVRNDLAARTAERFYDHVFSTTVLSAISHAMNVTEGTENENIYIVWGLPFVSLKPAALATESKKQVLKQLVVSAERWTDKLQVVQKSYQRETILVILRWLNRQLVKYFANEFRDLLRDGTLKIRQ